ncbi:hypothetical protein EIN_430530 [Entamoeba invadens IP1]|uniref:TNFR-Cys domain-containing protein n=1 Tax=Entamoeba invadens IP1 TaxID=370355 RepID=A0A0A1UHF8_ENTIV|nr:hypothetical protein EIN_430530 [Entamoeba invadens IP1]ELP95247.1 hypothetical protein EIN_430530 [Entamoeba invadens IP1]|eukprot:XP_004262018.1 hypothetical protein EIN_430530 [Entamoeba invadens IP1]
MTMSIVILSLFSLTFANIFVAKSKISLPQNNIFGIAASDSGVLTASGNAKISIVTVNDDTFETVRTDGPFRSLTDGYITEYSKSISQFVAYGGEKARFGRFSDTLVGDLVDYEPAFTGHSTFFIQENVLSLGFVPESKNGYIKVCDIGHIPRLDAPIVHQDDVVKSTTFAGTGHLPTDLKSMGKGVATVCVKDASNVCHNLLFIVGDHEGHDSVFSYLKIFELQDLSTTKPFYDETWGTSTYELYQNDKGYFNLGNLFGFTTMKPHYNEQMKMLFVMSENADIGSATSTKTPCVIAFTFSYDNENSKIRMTSKIITTPTFDYVKVENTTSFGKVMDSTVVDDVLHLVISAPSAVVQHATSSFSMGIVYYYKYTATTGFVFKMYTVPPVLENNYGFGRGISILSEGKKRRVFIINAKDNQVYESVIPLCGDGVVTTEIGEECDSVSSNCNAEQCLCLDGFVSMDGLCERKCERDTCKCTSTDSCSECTLELLNISTRCQECNNGYELLDGICKTVCGNKIRTSDEECDLVENCDDNCRCLTGYIPSSDKENKCVVSKVTALTAWMVVQIVIGILCIIIVVIVVLVKVVRKKMARLNINAAGGVAVYACGSTAKLDQFEEVEAERFPLYSINNSPFMYSFANDISFYIEGDMDHRVEKIELKKRYVFQLFIGNKSLNIASFAIGDPRLDKDDYDLEFMPDKGNLQGGDIICIYGKVTPLRECAVKETFTLTVVNLNTSKSFIQNIPLTFSAED